jgi:hypothetical protein
MLIKQYARVKLKDLTPNKRIDWSEEQLAMKEEIVDNYNPRIKTILISSDYGVCDGNHRYSILLEYYGGDHKIIVKKGRFSKLTYTIFSFVLISTLKLIGLPFYLIALLFKILRFRKRV